MFSFSVNIYRHLLLLYPASHRQVFSEEMIAVFGAMQAETASKGLVARSLFFVREVAGVVTGALLEHCRALGGDSVLLGGIVLGLAFFYAAGMIGWAVLFAMRRSGVHRLAETSAGPR